MRVIHAKSVSDGLAQGLHHLRVSGRKQSSRVGDVLVSPMPVMTIYDNPLNRVLFSPMRDANPFFHLMEALWMLAGRNDLPWLVQFNKRFASYSDDGGKTQPGAYGYRWRNYFGYDQLETLIVELRNNPQTRRAVLTMWDGGHPTYAFGSDEVVIDVKSDLIAAISGSNDVPCNTHAYFDMIDGRLNMTVCCRSNDIIWGAYGANAVHFSFLLEYVAAATGLPMGVYRQFSNNYHLYTNVFSEEQLMSLAREVEATDAYFVGEYAKRRPVELARVPLVVAEDGDFDFLLQLTVFLQHPETVSEGSSFFNDVAHPMFMAWQEHKAKKYDGAIACARMIADDAWRGACVQWLERRKIKHELNTQRFTDVTVLTAQDIPDGNA